MRLKLLAAWTDEFIAAVDDEKYVTNCVCVCVFWYTFYLLCYRCVHAPLIYLFTK